MDFENLELWELREKLDNKEITSVELTKHFLARIKEIDPKLNAFITVAEEEALAQAKDADDFINSPGENPLLCGIPFAAKDIYLTKGIRTTGGSKILENYIAPYDATVIAKLKEQKAVLIGKTNLDEFAQGSSNESSAYGDVKNPWDLTRVPGGSSGGSAASVAARTIPWALGTDTGGSIRSPAAWCGVSGWKPTYGRVSRYGIAAMASSLDTMGALAQSVKDLAMIAEVIAGHDSMDGTSGSIEVPAYSKDLDANLKGLKVGIPDEYFIEGMEAGVEEKLRAAIKQIEDLGAEVVKVSLPNTTYGSLVYAIVCPSEVSSNMARYDGIRYTSVAPEAKDLMEVYTKTREQGFGSEVKRRIMMGTYALSAGYYDAYYKKAQKVRRLIINEFNDIFKQVDVLLAPAQPMVAPKLGKFADNPTFAYIADEVNIPASLAGLSALSIPCGFSENLPVGLQIIGPQWGEQKVFNVGHAYQQATDWHKQFPKI